MSETNDKSPVNEALPTAIEYVTQSGVQIYITPLSLFVIQSIINKSEATYPYPPEKDYRLLEMEIDGEMVQAVDRIASGFFPATENPEYRELCKQVDIERVQWQNDAFIELACTYPQFENDLAMIVHFRPQLERMRPYVILHDDEWRNILEFCVFTGVIDLVDENRKRFRTPERHRVIQIARQNSDLALSMSEVVDGLRVFRYDLPGRNPK